MLQCYKETKGGIFDFIPLQGQSPKNSLISMMGHGNKKLKKIYEKCEREEDGNFFSISYYLFVCFIFFFGRKLFWTKKSTRGWWWGQMSGGCSTMIDIQSRKMECAWRKTTWEAGVFLRSMLNRLDVLWPFSRQTCSQLTWRWFIFDSGCYWKN